MKKRTVILLLAVICIVSTLAGAVGMGLVQEIKAQLRGDFTIVIDGEVQTFKNVNGETVYPVLYDGTTYLPVRAIGELMGKDVYWYENEKKVVLSDKNTGSTVTDADVVVDNKNEQVAQKPEIDFSSFIGEEKVKEIVLDYAGVTVSGVYFDHVELSCDNGIWHYDVEFKKNLTHFEAEIGAEDGAILEWEAEKD